VALRWIAVGRIYIGMLALSTLLLVECAHAAPGGDAKAGSDVFAHECSDCHSVKSGKNKKGPSLFGVVGRKSGTVADFSYSDAMLSIGIQWTADKIDAYITNPKAVVPGGKMKFDGLADAKAREDLLAFLAAQK
jgi:cytochrome c